MLIKVENLFGIVVTVIHIALKNMKLQLPIELLLFMR